MSRQELHLTIKDPETVARIKRLTIALPRPPRTTTRMISVALHLLERSLEAADDGRLTVVEDGVTKDWVIG